MSKFKTLVGHGHLRYTLCPFFGSFSCLLLLLLSFPPSKKIFIFYIFMSSICWWSPDVGTGDGEREDWFALASGFLQNLIKPYFFIPNQTCPYQTMQTIPNQTKTYQSWPSWTIFLDVFVIQKLCSSSFGTSQSCRIYFLRSRIVEVPYIFRNNFKKVFI